MDIHTSTYKHVDASMHMKTCRYRYAHMQIQMHTRYIQKYIHICICMRVLICLYACSYESLHECVDLKHRKLSAYSCMYIPPYISICWVAVKEFNLSYHNMDIYQIIGFWNYGIFN